MERLREKRIIVTGAGSGIGRAIALRFAAEEARVVISDVDKEAASRVAAEAGGEANGETLVRKTDVTNSSEIETLVETSVEEWGGLDVMVNNAGIGVAGTTTDTTEEDYERVMDVCLRGTFLGMKHAIPAIRDSGGGSVINMSSVAALVGITDRAVYSAAKGAILAITRAAAIDHVEQGVRVNCIAPGTVDTPLDRPHHRRLRRSRRGAPEHASSPATWQAGHAGGNRRDGGLPRLRRIGISDRGVHGR